MTNTPLKLSLEAARSLLLAAQRLDTPRETPAQKSDVLAAIQHMGLLQIDTISVVARSPYLVLWTRLGSYEPRWLDELLAEGALFEYWAHAICFLPIENYRLYRRLMLERAAKHPEFQTDPDMQRVLTHIQEHGTVKSADFVQEEKRGGTWWDWKPEKIALERLFNAGELMIARREGFQRVYNLRERILPDWDDAHAVPREAGEREMVLKAIHALGVAQARWLPLYFPDYLRSCISKPRLHTLLQSLVEEGALVPAQIADWKEPCFIHRDNLERAQRAIEGDLKPSRTTFLSPFDPVVSDRDRAEALFGFFYRIEVYTPAEKRKYGYFTLPILHKDQLVGRLDAKAHRKERLFEVRALHLEPHFSPTEEFIEALCQTLRECAAWHNTDEISVLHSDPPALRDALSRLLA